LNRSPSLSAGSIRAIVFDFGGVLLDWNPVHLYRHLLQDPAQIDKFLSDVDFSGWNAQQDKGRPFAVAVAELSSRFPQYADLIRAYRERWQQSIAGPIKGSVEILRALKAAGHRIYGLSNWSAETFPLARSRFDFFGELEGYLISGEVGLIKPDPEIFMLFTKKFRFAPAECLLIDDSVQNIAEARRLGFLTIHFQSADQLRRDLEKIGLLHSGQRKVGTE
jgi:2-haloacid dehalogenase